MANASSPHKTSQNATFAPKPLTPEQLNAIELLLQGQTDQAVADAIGRDRATIWTWRTRHPLFAATLEQRRQEIFGVAAQRLRTLLTKALDNIEAAIQSNSSPKWSFELIRACGLYGYAPPTGETDVQKIATRICWEQLAQEGIPETTFDLSHLDKNPGYEARQREILEELGEATD